MMSVLNRSSLQLFRKHARGVSSTITTPVLGNEVLKHIKPTNDAVILDMTFGSGGHTELLLGSDPSVKVLALDRDPVSHAVAVKLTAKYKDRLIPLLGKFSDLPNLLEPLGYFKESIDVMLFHCGCSSFQIESPSRGFSPLLEGCLDMRMDGNEGTTKVRAQDVLNTANEIDLKNIFKLYGCLKQGRKIAQAMLHMRHTSSNINSTTDLKDFLTLGCELSNAEVRSAFRSLRYFVNDELNELNHGLSLAEWYLKKGGRLVTISEAYLDDLIIKNHLSGHEPSNFVGPLPMEHLSFTAPLTSDAVAQNSPWVKLNKHVITPEGDKLMMMTSKLRAVVKT